MEGPNLGFGKIFNAIPAEFILEMTVRLQFMIMAWLSLCKISLGQEDLYQLLVQ